MMDVADFFKEFSRMCDEYNTCRGCPMDGKCNPCTEAVYKDPQGVVEIVEKWSKEHPTYTVNLGALNERQKRALRELGDAIIKIAEQSVQVIKEEFLPDYKAPKEDNK